jgi:tetratricopeptide (TPR) repeat protein
MSEVMVQPLGVFGLPAGFLLLLPGDGVAEAAEWLLNGRIPATFPAALRYYEHALAGDMAAAADALPAGDDPAVQVNRFVLQGTPAQYQVLCQRFNGVGDGRFRQILDVAAFTMGIIEAPPAVGDAQAEQLAFILMAQAAYALERQQPEQAITLLQSGIAAAEPVSPVLAAQLRGTLADTQFSTQGATPQVIQQYQAALQLLETSDLAETRAELWLNLGTAYQEMANGRRGALLEAVKCYQKALQTFTLESHPDLFALANNNLALAYLAMPLTEASDQLRSAVAVQSLRQALQVYDRDSYPAQWASAQLNLANALQYLPSTHPEENLTQAVELYEDLLAARSPQLDPLGYARLLANQGNALAHLGIFDHATAKLAEAQRLFEQCGEWETAVSVRELLTGMQNAAS